MNKNLRLGVYISSGLVFLGIITLVIIIGSKDDNRLSSPGRVGNTAGNLYNYGLFCEKDDRIYFSNPLDNGSIYSMTFSLDDFKKLYDDKVRYLNSDDNYIYYSRMNNLKSFAVDNVFTVYSSGIYRLDPESSSLTMLSSKPLGSMLVYNNNIYYQKYVAHEDLKICEMSLADTNEERDLITDDAVAVSVNGGKLFYSDSLHDHLVHSVNISTGTNSVVLDKKSYMPIATSSGIYYIATDNGYMLRRYNYDGTDTIITPYRVCTYNVSDNGRYIFYQRDEATDSGLYLYDAIMDETKLIIAGDYKWLNIAGNYCFFYDFSAEHVYASDMNGSLNIFNPPVLK